MKLTVLNLMFYFLTILLLDLTDCRVLKKLVGNRERIHVRKHEENYNLEEIKRQIPIESYENITKDRFFDQLVDHFDNSNVNNTWKQVEINVFY